MKGARLGAALRSRACTNDPKQGAEIDQLRGWVSSPRGVAPHLRKVARVGLQAHNHGVRPQQLEEGGGIACVGACRAERGRVCMGQRLERDGSQGAVQPVFVSAQSAGSRAGGQLPKQARGGQRKAGARSATCAYRYQLCPGSTPMAAHSPTPPASRMYLGAASSGNRLYSARR